MRFIQHIALILLLILAPTVASAAPPMEGRWTVRAAGRPFMLLELRREPAAKGGWAGSLSRPSHFQGSSNFTIFSMVEGPAIKEVVIATVPRADELELTVQDSSSELTQLIWRPLDEGGGTLKYKDFHFPPISFAPAGADERVADDWDKSRTYSAMLEWPNNPEMTQIFDADQVVRQRPGAIDLAVVGPQDEARRTRTKALLNSGKLRSGTDFYHAAIVFQHGGSADNYLLAHTFAIMAVARGRPDATWIASATLDRYLQSIGQNQIYGTQFTTPPDKPATQEPYNRTLVSDALRSALGVPPLSEQEKQRQEYEATFKREGTAKP